VTPESDGAGLRQKRWSSPRSTMFKAIRTQMDELGLEPDYRIHALSETARFWSPRMSIESVLRRFFCRKTRPTSAVIESPIKFRHGGAGRRRPYGVEPGRIAKNAEPADWRARGVDRRQAAPSRDGQQRSSRRAFGGKPKMLASTEFAAITGHDVGGVWPIRI